MRQIGFFIVGVFLGITSLIGLIKFQEGVPTSSSKWANDLYRVKEQHAQTAKSPKLLLVAGSNILFGIDAVTIEQTYNIPTTNFGVHAGLGLRYILDRSKRSLNPGDIVYLPLEYALYQQNASPSTQLMDFLLARDPEYLHTLPIFDQFLGYTNVSFERIFEGMKGGSDHYLGRSSRTYNVSNVDNSGNQINNTVEHASAHASKLKVLQAKEIGDGKISYYSREVLLEYFEWAKENNICLIGAPPNLLNFDIYKSEEFEYFFTSIRNFYLDNDIHFSGKSLDYLFPHTMFFDTEYHLNSLGVVNRTNQTINDLGPTLASNCSFRSS